MKDIPYAYWRLSLFTLQFIIITQMVVLHCFADVCDDGNYQRLENSIPNVIILIKFIKIEIFQQNVVPELKCSFINRLVYWYASELLHKGRRQQLDDNDLWALNNRDQSSTLLTQWHQLFDPIFNGFYYLKEKQIIYSLIAYRQKKAEWLLSSDSNTVEPKRPSLFVPLIRLTCYSLSAVFATALLFTILQFCRPLFLQ